MMSLRKSMTLQLCLEYFLNGLIQNVTIKYTALFLKKIKCRAYYGLK